MDRRTSIFFSLLAGVFGSCGSISGKLSGTLDKFLIGFGVGSYLAEALFLVLMVMFNTLGCSFYAISLDSCSNSLQPTVLSCAANYFFSAIAAFLLFNEITSWTWWLGTSLIFTGLIILLKSQTDTNHAIKQE